MYGIQNFSSGQRESYDNGRGAGVRYPAKYYWETIVRSGTEFFVRVVETFCGLRYVALRYGFCFTFHFGENNFITNNTYKKYCKKRE